jgi:hypothetical protein
MPAEQERTARLKVEVVQDYLRVSGLSPSRLAKRVDVHPKTLEK